MSPDPEGEGPYLPLEPWRKMVLTLIIGIPAIILLVLLASGTGITEGLEFGLETDTNSAQPTNPEPITLDTIQGQVADDAIVQYRIADESGTKMDKCVQAGIVAAAFLQKHEKMRYSYWKRAEIRDCRAAGVPIL